MPRVNFIETQRYFIRPLPVHCLKTSINENAIHFTCTHCLEPPCKRAFHRVCMHSITRISFSFDVSKESESFTTQTLSGGYFILHPDFSRKRRRIRTANPLTSPYFSGRRVNLLKKSIFTVLSQCFHAFLSLPRIIFNFIKFIVERLFVTIECKSIDFSYLIVVISCFENLSRRKISVFIYFQCVDAKKYYVQVVCIGSVCECTSLEYLSENILKYL